MNEEAERSQKRERKQQKHTRANTAACICDEDCVYPCCDRTGSMPACEACGCDAAHD